MAMGLAWALVSATVWVLAWAQALEAEKAKELVLALATATGQASALASATVWALAWAQALGAEKAKESVLV